VTIERLTGLPAILRNKSSTKLNLKATQECKIQVEVLDSHLSILGPDDPCDVIFFQPKISPDDGISLNFHTNKEEMKCTYNNNNGTFTLEKFSIMGPAGILSFLRVLNFCKVSIS
jgi:hypothetical protein